MLISVVMPCYNEEDIIEKVVRNYYEEISSCSEDLEFIVIDDSSSDHTRNILEKLKIELSKLRVLKTASNSGHGKAMRMGYESARGEFIFQVDSDNQFEIKDFQKLFALKDEFSFVLGFRKNRQDALHRKILTKIISIVDFILFGVWINDANCPFRLIKRETLNSLLKSIDNDAVAPNIMISILAKKKGIRMIEVPVRHYQRKSGVVSIANWRLVKFALKGLRQLIVFKARFNKL